MNGVCCICFDDEEEKIPVPSDEVTGCICKDHDACRARVIEDN